VKNDKLLSIADIEHETGITRETLRKWEQRYNFPVPQRNQRGERTYNNEQLERLQLIKKLLDSGLQPSRLAGLDLQQLQQMVMQVNNHPDTPPDVELLINTLRDGKVNALRALLNELLQRYGLKRFVIEVVAPMNSAVGEAWFSGRIGILDEHLYVEELRLMLLHVLHNLPINSEMSRVLLTTFPGEQHGLGLLMVACLLAMEGSEVVLLGVQTPIEEIVRGATERNCSVVGISCSEYMSRRTVATQLVRLRNLLPQSIELWAGGSGIANLPAMPNGVQLFKNLDQIQAAAKPVNVTN